MPPRRWSHTRRTVTSSHTSLETPRPIGSSSLVSGREAPTCRWEPASVSGSSDGTSWLRRFDESRTNRFSEIGFDLIRAQIVSQVVVHGMKYSIRRDRPTGECCAFPSGHAATAFAVASVLERHLGYRASWPALVGATYVATSRLVDNRHFLSDVLMGAGVGTAAGWTVVGTRGRSGYVLQPVPVKGGMMLAFTRVKDEN